MSGIVLKALPPKEAIKFFQAKGYAIGFDWRDVWQAEHQAAFTVAKAMSVDILRDIHDAVESALVDGTTFEEFQERLEPLLMRRGWWGRAKMTDPLTGKKKLVQLGSTRRLRTIYDTNLRTAHSEGQWQRIQDNIESFPYLEYDGNNSEHPRLTHSAWDGMVLPANDPFWTEHMPIKAWGCKCRVIQLNESLMKQIGKKGPDTAPDVPKYEYINKRTGEVQQVPKGVDPEFNYPYGGQRRRENAAKMFAGKAAAAPPKIGAAAFAGAASTIRPLIGAEYASWVDQLAAGQLARGNRRVVGAFTDAELGQLAAENIEPESAAITAVDRDITHMLRQAKRDAGKALPAEAVRNLPALMGTPRAVLWDKLDPAFIYVFDVTGEPRSGKTVVRVNYTAKVREPGAKRKTVLENRVISGGLVSIDALRDENRYELVRGTL